MMPTGTGVNNWNKPQEEISGLTILLLALDLLLNNNNHPNLIYI